MAEGEIVGKALIIDSFAGGGGASTGIEMALGRSPDYALNHDAVALGVHAANHPHTKHLVSNIWQAEPREIDASKFITSLGGPHSRRFGSTLTTLFSFVARAIGSCIQNETLTATLFNVNLSFEWHYIIDRQADGTPDLEN